MAIRENITTAVAAIVDELSEHRRFSRLTRSTIGLMVLTWLSGCAPAVNSYKLQRTQKELDANRPAEAQSTLDSCIDGYQSGEPAALYLVSFAWVWAPICIVDKNHEPVLSLQKQIVSEQQKTAELSEVAAELKAAANAFESGRYASAREEYRNASKNNYLNDAQKREALDGICISEQKAGEPLYSVETQYGDCLEASKQADSAISSLLAPLLTQVKSYYSRSIDTAIAAHDDSQAEVLLDKYKTVSDADPSRISDWERQIRQITEAKSLLEKKHEAERAEAEEERAKPAISRLERRYPEMRRLSQEQFEDFLIKNYAVDSAPFFTDARVDGHSLQVITPNPDVQTITSSQATLDEINDYFVAWCGCNGQTHIIGDYYGRRMGLATVDLSVEDQHSYVTTIGGVEIRR